MLNKLICKKCQDCHRYRGWSETKENNWVLKGRVWCISQDDFRRGKFDRSPWVSIHGSPPETCYYLTEQIVSEKEESEDA